METWLGMCEIWEVTGREEGWNLTMREGQGAHEKIIILPGVNRMQIQTIGQPNYLTALKDSVTINFW